MNKEQYNDLQLIKAIRKSGEEREKAIKFLFHHEGFRSISSEVVLKGGGDHECAKQVYKNCLIELDKLVRRNRYKEESLAKFFKNEVRINWCKLLITEEWARQIALNTLIHDKELEGKIHALILKNSGTIEDARDMYQNGLILLNEHLEGGKFRGGAIKGFFYQVCYNLWRNELKRSKTITLPESGVELKQGTAVNPEEALQQKESKKLLDLLFNELSSSCQKLLQLKFMVVDTYSMAEIAQKMGFKNAQIAANALSKCRKHLWALLQNHKPSFEWIRNMYIG